MKLGLGVVLGAVTLGLVGWAVVAPVLRSARPPALRTTCLSNVKQIGVALQIYLADADDRFPSRDLWIDATYPYAKSWPLFHCPEEKGAWGYAFNGALDRARTPKRPEEVPLVYDSANPIKNASDLFASLPAVSRHGRNIVGYADGHARAVPARAFARR